MKSKGQRQGHRKQAVSSVENNDDPEMDATNNSNYYHQPRGGVASNNGDNPPQNPRMGPNHHINQYPETGATITYPQSRQFSLNPAFSEFDQFAEYQMPQAQLIRVNQPARGGVILSDASLNAMYDAAFIAPRASAIINPSRQRDSNSVESFQSYLAFLASNNVHPR